MQPDGQQGSRQSSLRLPSNETGCTDSQEGARQQSGLDRSSASGESDEKAGSMPISYPNVVLTIFVSRVGPTTNFCPSDLAFSGSLAPVFSSCKCGSILAETIAAIAHDRPRVRRSGANRRVSFAMRSTVCRKGEAGTRRDSPQCRDPMGSVRRAQLASDELRPEPLFQRETRLTLRQENTHEHSRNSGSQR